MIIRFAIPCLFLSLSACGTDHREVVDRETQVPGGSAGSGARDEGNDELPIAAASRPAAQTTSPYDGIVHAIPGVIEAEHYDEGDPDVAYHDIDEQNLGADYRGETQVDIEKRDDASNGHGVGWTRTGEWLHYTVDIQRAGEFSVEFPVASNKQGGIFHLEIDGVDVTGPIQVPDTGGWDRLEIIKAKTGPLQPGLSVLRVVMDSQGESGSIGDIDLMRFVPQP